MINRTKYHGMVIGENRQRLFPASAPERRSGTSPWPLLENENIFALGCGDEADRVTGIVVRGGDLFDILGKPFGGAPLHQQGPWRR